MFWAWVQHVQHVLDSLRLRLSEWMSINKWTKGPLVLVCHVQFKRWGPTSLPMPSGDICWCHLILGQGELSDLHGFGWFRNQHRWRPEVKPHRTWEISALWKSGSENCQQLDEICAMTLKFTTLKAHLENTWRTQLDLKSIDKFSNRHLSCKNIRLDWADGFPLHSTWTAVRSWVESMLIDDSPLITIS
jgi:hypothetical protein